MKKNRKLVSLLLAALAASCLLTACGSRSYSAARAPEAKMAGGAPAMNMMAETAAAASYDGAYGLEMADYAEAPMEESSELPSPTANRKLIRNIYSDITVSDSQEIQPLIKRIGDEAVALGGYKTNESSGSGYSSYGNINVKVPSPQADIFMERLKDGGINITSLNDSLEDVTMQYTDIESRLASSRAAKDRYMELLKKADAVEDIISIQTRIDEIIADEESYQSQLNVMKSNVDFTNINFSISCERNYEKQTFGSKFLQSMRYLVDEIGDTVIWGIEWIVTTLVRLVFILPIIYIVIRVLARALGKKKLFGDRKWFQKKTAAANAEKAAAPAAESIQIDTGKVSDADSDNKTL